MRLDPELAQIRTDLQAAANRRNALQSTGPITHEGRATSSLNALKTGLTGRTVLLHSDDFEAYCRHLQEYETEYKPEGLRERELVQSLADTQWRLQRIPRLEMAIYAQGRADNQPYCDRHGEVAPGLLELGTYLKFEKSLRNLQLQESRLQRRFDKEREELTNLQRARLKATPKPAEADPLPTAVVAANSCRSGFEFSTRASHSHSANESDSSRVAEASACVGTEVSSGNFDGAQPATKRPAC